jgi:hypothetical protein
MSGLLKGGQAPLALTIGREDLAAQSTKGRHTIIETNPCDDGKVETGPC